jgi:hypothetical protein
MKKAVSVAREEGKKIFSIEEHNLVIVVQEKMVVMRF